MADTRIGRTVSVAGSRRKATFSAWVKRTGLGEAWLLACGGTYSSGSVLKMGFNSANGCFIIETAGTPRIESNNLFRDTSGYYNYVVGIDTEQSVAADRLKFYINGVQVTSFATETYPTLNQDLPMNNTGSDNNMWLGGRGESTYEFDGIMSHVHWIDGTQYAASDFGSTNADTGEWVINTAPSVTYGENGYFMLKDGSSLTDASGEGNNFTLLTGTLTNTEDCPSDVFCVFDGVVPQTPGVSGRDGSAVPSLANGNTTIGAGTAAYAPQVGTIFATKGKYYFECKGGGDPYQFVGIANPYFSDTLLGGAIGHSAATNSNSIGMSGNNGVVAKNAVTQYTGSTFTTEIVCVAMDLDNGFFYTRLDGGSWFNSGDPESGVTGTGGVAIPDGFYTFGATTHNNSGSGTNYMYGNFGNGYFGTTIISSAGTNASDIGIFEYDVPAGYTALSTKGLQE